MKKIIITLCAALFGFAVFAADNSIPAIMMQPSGALYEENDGIMEYKKSLDKGTELKVLTVTNENGLTVPEVKKSKRIVEKKQRDCTMYHVSYDGKKFWVLYDRISMEESVVAVKIPAAIYRSPDIADVKDVSLPIGEMVTIGKKFVANGKFDMYKVSYYNAKSYEVISGYILCSKITADEKDMKAFNLIAKLKDAKDEAVRDELYKNITKLNISSEVSAYATEVMDSLTRKTDLTSQGYSTIDEYGYVINQDTSSKVNLRKEPGTDKEVAGSFSESITSVYISEVTNAIDVIGNSEYPWYHVESDDGTEGWVFGEYISFSYADEL